ncbi:sensor histidine kinase [Terrilactibacillus sp. BCM23-1]|uniref:Sensor histidine kinase n=1 Tax=Terrilactibacillus tamarindi TaxID=2599694 RepID=A0A6N8CVD9_9BACI|nr:sensor histidine kinase [Terrilactibacillus tamarindi]MTT33253.1 sensor histidine kinase [Terrilactibacillus tamarindi]
MIKRSLFTGILTALISFITCAVIIFYVFPLHRWSLLWSETIAHIPLILFIVIIIVLLGLIYGIMSILYWRGHFKTIDETLNQFEKGNLSESVLPEKKKEIQTIINHLYTIHKQLKDQTLRTQKIVSENVETKEKLIQDIVSEERSRLARELHDSVSQQLFAASMLMSTINETHLDLNHDESKQLKLIEQMIQQSQLEMRALLLHLRPIQLKGKSLKEGMEELLQELRTKVNLMIKWKIESIALPIGVENHLFRILQECVSNTLRHARAESLDVLLIKRDQFVIMRLIDDGQGFDVNKAKSGSYGLQNMKERAMEIGGTVKVVSLAKKGTRLEVKVPIVEENNND